MTADFPVMDLLQVLFFLAVPAGVLYARRYFAWIDTLSPIAACYMFGIIAGNIVPGFFTEQLALNVSAATVLLAIPLLLFSVDVLSWTRLAGRTLASMLLAFASVVVVSSIAAFFFSDRIPDVAPLAGMLTGLFTGGTINMAAIKTALNVEAETFVLANLADVAICGSYYLFVLSVGCRWYGKILPVDEQAACDVPTSTEGWDDFEQQLRLQIRDVVKPMLLAIAAAAVAGATTLLVSKDSQEVAAILTVTTLAIALSFVPKVRAMPGSYPTGEYLLMMFGVATGSMAQLSKLFAEGALIYILFVGLVLISTIALHVLLCKLTGIDRDTMLVTSVAALFGPAFVGPLASRLNRPELLVSGVGCGLIGLAAGTYIGVTTAQLLAGWL